MTPVMSKRFWSTLWLLPLVVTTYAVGMDQHSAISPLIGRSDRTQSHASLQEYAAIQQFSQPQTSHDANDGFILIEINGEEPIAVRRSFCARLMDCLCCKNAHPAPHLLDDGSSSSDDDIEQSPADIESGLPASEQETRKMARFLAMLAYVKANINNTYERPYVKRTIEFLAKYGFAVGIDRWWQNDEVTLLARHNVAYTIEKATRGIPALVRIIGAYLVGIGIENLDGRIINPYIGFQLGLGTIMSLSILHMMKHTFVDKKPEITQAHSSVLH